MKKVFSILVSIAIGILLTASLFAQSPDWLWAKSAGGTFDDYGNSVATDANGNTFVCGYFESPSITFGSYTLTNAGGRDIFLVKYDASGNVLWAKSAGGTEDDRGYSVATDANGNCFVTGFFYSSSITFGSYTLTNAGGSDIFLVKYDASGNVLWAKSAGGTEDDRGYSVATDASGNCYVTGSFHSSSITFGSYTLTNAGYLDMFLVKYDANGNVIWAKSAGGTGDDDGNSVATDANGNCFVTGSFDSPSITFGSYTLTNANAGNMDMFLVKYDANGNVLWAKSAGGTDDDEGNSVATDANGNCFVTGGFWSLSITFGSYTLTNANAVNMDMFLVKYDANGNVIWAKSAGGTDDDEGNSVATDANGNCFVTGSFESSSITFGSYTLTNAGNNDIFLVKYDASGNVIWAKSAGGTDNDWGNSVATDASGNCYVTGGFGSSSITFGSYTLTNASADADIFLAKLSNTNGINDNNLSSDNIVIYPNPNTGAFTLSFTAQQGGEAEINVLNILGKTVYTEKCFIAQDNYAKEINLGKITSGIYILQVKVGGKIYNYKLQIRN
jgi:hypothetical protein